MEVHIGVLRAKFRISSGVTNRGASGSRLVMATWTAREGRLFCGRCSGGGGSGGSLFP